MGDEIPEERGSATDEGIPNNEHRPRQILKKARCTGLKGKVFARGAFFRPDRFSFLISPSLLLSATRPSVWVLPGGGWEGRGGGERPRCADMSERAPEGREERITFLCLFRLACSHVVCASCRDRPLSACKG